MGFSLLKLRENFSTLEKTNQKKYIICAGQFFRFSENNYCKKVDIFLMLELEPYFALSIWR